MIETRVESKPLWLEDYPTVPLSSGEQDRFAGLKWINFTRKGANDSQSGFGARWIKIGSPTEITIIAQDEPGSLVKRIIPQEDEVSGWLGGAGRASPELTLYRNDSEVLFGPNDFGNARIIVFQKEVDLNAKTIQEAMEVAEEFQILVQQIRTSKKVEEAKRNFLESIASITNNNQDVAKSLFVNVDKKLQEAAIQPGLIETSMGELSKRLRTFPDRMEKSGIKTVEFKANRTLFWPVGVRVWGAETQISG
ncbi:MAG: hypothetical protein HW400_365 [Candidatus Levybacteria bacterium]|nr:hypothetical protein [Candidatus Levybacteria bacterium]